MSWFYLFLGMAVSLAGNFLIKASNGFENLAYGLGSLVLFMIGISLYGFAIKVIPLNVAYIIWTGVSIVLLLLVSVFFFGEKLSVMHIFFMSLIIIGSVGLKMLSKV